MEMMIDYDLEKVIIDGVELDKVDNNLKLAVLDKFIKIGNIQNYLYDLHIECELSKYEDLGYCDTCGTDNYIRSGMWNDIKLKYEESCFDYGFSWECEDEVILKAIRDNVDLDKLLPRVIDWNNDFDYEDIDGYYVYNIEMEAK